MEDMVGAMNYSCLDEMCSEEAEFMSQLLVNCNSINHDHVESESSSTLWLADHETAGLMYQSSSINHHHLFPTDHALNMMTMDYCNHVMGSRDDDDDDNDVMNLQQDMSEESNKSFSQDHVAESNKRLRIPGDIPVPRNRRGGVKVSKRAKVDDEINNGVNHMKASSSCYSEDGLMSNSSCSRATPKARAGRGSATDPQSLYARKRRERINERLKILQKLVPNGTKVDISTMLEEAVQYVKFLQLQIKLLSSDDLWMYAPIAYNGMDIGALNSFQH